MKSIIAVQPDPVRVQQKCWRASIANFWLRIIFFCARYAPWLVKLLKRPAVYLIVRFSRSVRSGTFANAKCIFGSDISQQKSREFSHRVVGRFCDFILSVGQSASLSPQQLRSRIESVEGREEYMTRREKGGGAILITAHMGSFETGLAALAEVEPNVHVVFKRDAFDGFESIRRQLREKLNVQEAPIDDGWQTWMKLRDALQANHVVVLQADRAMSGQKSEIVPFLHGRLRLPLGPLKLALASGSPIIPVFTIMTSPTCSKLFIEPAIEVVDERDAIMQIAKSIEKFVARYPDQWLVLHAAFADEEKI